MVVVVVVGVVVVVVVVEVVEVVVVVVEEGLGNKLFLITVGGGSIEDMSKRPPQVRTHSSPCKKLLPLPPHPEYRNFLHELLTWSW